MQGTMPMSQPHLLLNTSPDRTRHTHSGSSLGKNFQASSLGRIQQARQPPELRTLWQEFGHYCTLLHIHHFVNRSLLRK